MRYIHLTFDPAEETQEQFDIRVDEAIVATGLPAGEVTVCIREISAAAGSMTGTRNG